jgi:deoxyribodipyrimidine photolyase-related protein
VFTRRRSDGAPDTDMACVGSVLTDVDAHGWTHHIPRLMVLGNLGLLAGVDPAALTAWMWASFVDGAEWVMVPNVVGMALHADGGRMASKPYAAGGNYIDRMSDFCGGCRYDRRKRTGPDACPFTTLYWDFVARHEERLLRNPRTSRQVHAARRLVDLDEVRRRATDVLVELDAGRI